MHEELQTHCRVNLVFDLKNILEMINENTGSAGSRYMTGRDESHCRGMSNKGYRENAGVRMLHTVSTSKELKSRSWEVSISSRRVMFPV